MSSLQRPSPCIVSLCKFWAQRGQVILGPHSSVLSGPWAHSTLWPGKRKKGATSTTSLVGATRCGVGSKGAPRLLEVMVARPGLTPTKPNGPPAPVPTPCSATLIFGPPLSLSLHSPAPHLSPTLSIRRDTLPWPRSSPVPGPRPGRPFAHPAHRPRSPEDPASPPRWQECRAGRPLL